MDSEDVQALVGGIVALGFFVVCLAALVVFYLRGRRQAGRASAADQASIQNLWTTAQRMETRIGYLETVLDTEVPGWRSRSGMR